MEDNMEDRRGGVGRNIYKYAVVREEKVVLGTRGHWGVVYPTLRKHNL